MRSDEIFERAKKSMVGGVCAGGRFNPVMGKPLILESADGCIMHDVDGNDWIDYYNSSGGALLGYNHPAIRKALQESITLGFFMNYESPFHVEFAEQISRMVPSAQKVRLANSGTEATLAALRLAREYSGKRKILKFEGHFHGMHDFLFYNWHNRLGKPLPSGDIEKVWDTQGLVKELDDLLVVVPFNEPGILKQTIERQADQIAAVILEPIMYNAGCIEPIPGFLQDLRDLTQKHGILLIFDEVLSGFRMHRGGAQGYYEITPDLCTLAKAVGCGMTVAALAGRDEVMSHLNPVGRVVMSGTYTGSLMTVMGALAALKVLDEKGFYEQLNERAGYFYSHVSDLLRAKGLKAVVHGVGARFGLYFGLEQAPKSIREVASKYNRKAMHRFSELSVVKRLYFHDFGDGIAPMHAGFTAVHTKEIFDESLNRLEDIFGQMAKERL